MNYTTGTVTLTNGSTAVTGSGTGWTTALIVGGVIYPQAAGNPLPIASVDSNTEITAATEWTGATGTYAYALARQDDENQVIANAIALADYIARLGKPSLAAIAGLTPEADKFPYYTGSGSADLAAITAFARTLLAANDAPEALMALDLEVTAYAKTLLESANAAAARATLEAGVLSGFRNKIINGDLTGTIPGFPINQRAHATPTAPGVGVYGYDRWKGHANGLEQVCEHLEAGEYTLSWTGGGSGMLDGGSLLPSPIKATVAAGNVSVVVPASAGRVSLVRGDATMESDPFAPRHIQQELALCQRYYWKTFNVSALGRAYNAANGRDINVWHPVQIRGTPSRSVSMGTAYHTASIVIGSSDAFHTAVNVKRAGSDEVFGSFNLTVEAEFY